MTVDLLTHLGAPAQPSRFINRYVTSHILHPFELAAIRLLLSLYAFLTIFYSLGYESNSSSTDENFSAKHFLSYFTNLCYWGLAFYLLFAGLHGLAYHFTQRRRMSAWQLFELERWPRGLQAAHAIFYSSVVTFAPLVTIVFWAVIYKGPFYPLTFDAWRNVRALSHSSLFELFKQELGIIKLSPKFLKLIHASRYLSTPLILPSPSSKYFCPALYLSLPSTSLSSLLYFSSISDLPTLPTPFPTSMSIVSLIQPNLAQGR